MKIIINGFHGSDFSSLVKKLIDNDAFDEIFYLGTNECKENYADIKKFKFFDCGKISWGKYPDDPPQMPLDRTIIEENYETESYCLRMMDRLEFCEILSYAQRKEIYLAHLKYWNSIIENNDISAFISSNLPHEIYDFIIYMLCNKRRIKTILFHQTQFFDRYVCVDDLFSFNLYGVPSLIKDTSIKNGDGERIKYLDDLFEKMNQKRIPKPFYMQSVSNATVDRQTKKLRKIYKNISVSADYSQPFIFLALHYQPELTTSPLAHGFVDQILIIEMLSYCLPDGVFLYVKEHPRQTHIGRSESFYDITKKHKNVKFLRLDTDSGEAIDHSLAVATATGTVGWEALFRGKPVLMFGDFIYMKSPGIYRINNMSQCRKAINSVIAPGYEFPNSEHREYIRHLYDASIHGYVDPAYRKQQKLPEDKNCEVLYALIISRLGIS